MNSEELINRAFAALGRIVKLTYAGQERNEIVFGFSDDTFFGFLKGAKNFEITLSRDIEDSMNYIQVTIKLLNDRTQVKKRYHKSFIIPILKSNKNFSLASLYSRGVLGSSQDFIYDT